MNVIFDIFGYILLALSSFIAVAIIPMIGEAINPKPKSGARQDREAEQNQERW